MQAMSIVSLFIVGFTRKTGKKDLANMQLPDKFFPGLLKMLAHIHIANLQMYNQPPPLVAWKTPVQYSILKIRLKGTVILNRYWSMKSPTNGLVTRPPKRISLTYG